MADTEIFNSNLSRSNPIPKAVPGPIRGLIFDLDGTLIDSKVDLINSVNAMLREIGRGAPYLIAQALGPSNTEAEQKRGLQFFLSHYEEHKLDHTCPYPGVAET